LYLLEGDPGSGKTTMALQFLIQGAKRGETVLYITLAENDVELRAVADAHGFSMEGVHVHEVIPEESLLDPGEQYTVLHPSEVELGETNELILQMIERLNPSRVVLDSLSELQLLSGPNVLVLHCCWTIKPHCVVTSKFAVSPMALSPLSILIRNTALSGESFA
jgi:circadian clock protein KaiC